MITAKEALEASKKTQTDFIENQIQSAIDQGLYQVTFESDLSDENKGLLEENGFMVSEIQLMDGISYTINWENA